MVMITTIIGGFFSVILGLLILIFPKLLRILLGFYFLIIGVLAVIAGI